MSAKDDQPISVTVPTTVAEAKGLPEKIYVTFTIEKHKKTLLKTFPNYERTAIVKELAEFWFPYVIPAMKKAMAQGREKITFTLTPEADEDD